METFRARSWAPVFLVPQSRFQTFSLCGLEILVLPTICSTRTKGLALLPRLECSGVITPYCSFNLLGSDDPHASGSRVSETTVSLWPMHGLHLEYQSHSNSHIPQNQAASDLDINNQIFVLDSQCSFRRKDDKQQSNNSGYVFRVGDKNWADGGWVWWLIPVIPALWEAESSLAPAELRIEHLKLSWFHGAWDGHS
ncbi:Protein PPP5D1 [Plecturocebus cupreus]